jgi:hypothetical protein
MCYNRGCQLLTRGDWAEAEEALRQAEEMCESQMKVHFMICCNQFLSALLPTYNAILCIARALFNLNLKKTFF